MFTKQKKDPVISAISAIQTILDVATVAGIPLDKNLSQDSLALWVNLTDGLYDIMDGEAMGIMFALILEFAHKGYALNDIKSIQLNQSGNDFSLKLLFKDESSGTATFHSSRFNSNYSDAPMCRTPEVGVHGDTTVQVCGCRL
jgi:hypothetical protein